MLHLKQNVLSEQRLGKQKLLLCFNRHAYHMCFHVCIVLKVDMHTWQGTYCMSYQTENREKESDSTVHILTHDRMQGMLVKASHTGDLSLFVSLHCCRVRVGYQSSVSTPTGMV